MIKLIIFDLDGTLLNTIEDLACCSNYILRQCGLPEHDIDAYRYFVGNGIPNLIERMLPKHLQNDEKFKASVLEQFMPYYEIHKADKTAPYSEIAELLSELQKRDIAIAVASNKVNHAIKPLLDHYFPQITFVAALGQREAVPLKPHPQIVFDIMKIADVLPEEVLYVGDTGVDMQTSLHAGVMGIGALWGFRTEEEIRDSGAKEVIRHPMELLEKLKTKN
ncbi:MAG: HAD family hydrolase [Bacteroidales bacterium]|jgi:phosphoglycolate phosphatase|nr:HAD family hydrolase [Bacteroidales bacterium]